MHNITPNQDHAILRLAIAFNSTDAAEITDGMNEALRDLVSTGFVADYEFYAQAPLFIVTASDEPEEGELFEKVGVFVVFIEDAAGSKVMVEVESDLPLSTLPLNEARLELSRIMVLKETDRVFIQRVSDMTRLTLEAEGSL